MGKDNQNIALYGDEAMVCFNLYMPYRDKKILIGLANANNMKPSKYVLELVRHEARKRKKA